METEIKKIFEMMKKLNPDFNLSEDSFPTFNTQPQPQAKQQQSQPQVQQKTQQSYTPKSGDVKTYDKAQQTAKAVNTKSAKVNTTTEFPEAFRVWFTKLGYTPEKGNITIARVMAEIRKVMLQLGYK